MASKNFKVKNGLTLEGGSTDTDIVADGSGGILIGGAALSSVPPTFAQSTILISNSFTNNNESPFIYTLSGPPPVGGVTDIVFAYNMNNNASISSMSPYMVNAAIPNGGSFIIESTMGNLPATTFTKGGDAVYDPAMGELRIPVAPSNNSSFTVDKQTSLTYGLATAGKFLTNDGSDVSWGTISEVPPLLGSIAFSSYQSFSAGYMWFDFSMGLLHLENPPAGFVQALLDDINAILEGSNFTINFTGNMGYSDQSFVFTKYGMAYLESGTNSILIPAGYVSGPIGMYDQVNPYGFVEAVIPEVLGTAGKYLSSNGTSAVWSTVSSGTQLPSYPMSQSILQHNGSFLEWTNTISYPIIYGPVIYGASQVEQIYEKINVANLQASGTIDFDVNYGAVMYYTANATGNWTLNIRGDMFSSFNAVVDANKSVTLVFLVQNGSVAYRQTGFKIDNANVTPKWIGGTAPTAGNANSIDAYTITIIKTASSTYTVLESLTKFA